MPEEKSKYNILLVDDDKFLLDIYSTKFHQAGYVVDVAMGGLEALDKLENGKFNVVLMDIVMPSMDGFELLEKMKEKKLDKGKAIIVLSNQGQSADIEKAKKYGIAGYIVKANTIPSEVLSKVLDILKGFDFKN